MTNKKLIEILQQLPKDGKIQFEQQMMLLRTKYENVNTGKTVKTVITIEQTGTVIEQTTKHIL